MKPSDAWMCFKNLVIEEFLVSFKVFNNDQNSFFHYIYGLFVKVVPALYWHKVCTFSMLECMVSFIAKGSFHPYSSSLWIHPRNISVDSFFAQCLISITCVVDTDADSIYTILETILSGSAETGSDGFHSFWRGVRCFKICCCCFWCWMGLGIKGGLGGF